MIFSGFLNVSKLENGLWKYQFEDKVHTDYSLKNLEFIVRMHGLKWAMLDDELAQKSLASDENVLTGFLNVYIESDYNGDKWCYRGHSLKSRDLNTLKKQVLANGLEWKITDKNLALKSIEKNKNKYNSKKVEIRDNEFKAHLAEEKQKQISLKKEIRKEIEENKTGYFRVSKDGNYWKYSHKNTQLKAKSIDELEKLVLENDLIWKVLDTKKASASRASD